MKIFVSTKGELTAPRASLARLLVSESLGLFAEEIRSVSLNVPSSKKEPGGIRRTSRIAVELRDGRVLSGTSDRAAAADSIEGAVHAVRRDLFTVFGRAFPARAPLASSSNRFERRALRG